MDTYPPPRLRFVVAMFTAVGVLSAIAAALSSGGAEISFARQLAHSEFIWLLFAALSPLVLWTARRYPLTGSRLRRSVPAHLLTFAAMSVAHTLVYTTTIDLVTAGNVARVIDIIRGTWLRNMRADVFVYSILVGCYYLYAYAIHARVLRSETARQRVTNTDAAVQAPPDRLVVKARGRISFVALEDIEAIEADGDYVRVRASGRSHLVRETLRSMEQSLDAQRFLRIHRSTIVNVSRISALQPHQHGEFFAIMASGARLKVSRNYRSAIAAAMRVRG